MRGRSLLCVAAALFLVGCGVKSQRVPDDHEGYVRVFRQLNQDERVAFSTWWNNRALRLGRGTATAEDFDITVGQAIAWATPSPERLDQLKAERDRCGNHPCPIPGEAVIDSMEPSSGSGTEKGQNHNSTVF